MRRTFSRRWVSPQAGAKVTQTPENGRLAPGEQRSGTVPAASARNQPACRYALVSLTMSCSHLVAHTYAIRGTFEDLTKPGRLIATGELISIGVCLLQVEGRDSGTESDDEADRTDSGKCTTLAYSSLTASAGGSRGSSCDLARMSYREFPRRPVSRFTFSP